ncbi:hypothetical protein QUB68_20010 [Microcoleus sp. A006_D1]|uniref:hypothetical protein n=1 Tax=Microcoleus sp. A006_D1 TaxID=3055267 RepID=UPI002FD0CC37
MNGIHTTQTHESSFWACTQTHTRKSSDEGKIKSIKNEAGQRLYDVESYGRPAIGTSTPSYCPVSSTKQRDDLTRQVEFMPERHPEAEIIQDIGSGLNFKRKVRFV